MRKPTVAEMREKDVLRLAERTTEPEAIEKARKALNSYYRLAGLSERLFYINNSERAYTRCFNSGVLADMEAQEDRWIKRLNEYLKPFGLAVVFTGIYPSIVRKGERNCIEEVFTYGYFYN